MPPPVHGLFPPLDNEAASISTDELQRRLDSLEEWEPTDRFFYSRALGLDDVEGETDFERYDKLVKREEQIRHRIALLDRSADLRVNEQLEQQFDAGPEYARFHKRYTPIRKPQKAKEKDLALLRETSRGSNRTEVIDYASDIKSLEPMRQDKPKNHIQRKLVKQQIQMIALGGTLGVGLYLGSGRAFSIAGPLGCFLGFLISGSIVLATMLSFAEMSTLIPTTSSISGLASRFVEDAFGFALGWCYWLSFTIAMPSEVCAATIMLSYYSELNVPSASTAGFIALFLLFIIGINLFDVRVYGNIEYCTSLIKVLFSAALIIAMVVINVKEHYGFLYWTPSKSPPWATYGPFRPTFDLNDVGQGATDGIGGALGRLMGVLSSVLISSYAYTGSEIGFVASMECKNPRKALPSVTKRVFGRVVILYLLSIFLVGLNMYSGDPRLLRYYSPEQGIATLPVEALGFYETQCTTIVLDKYSNGNQSPWIIALQSSGMCTFSAVLNAVFIMFGITAGSSHLYVSSRTLYSMAIQGKAFTFFSICSKAGVPYVAVLFSGAFGLLGFLSVNNTAYTVFQDFANISSATAMMMWAGMCLSFLRFYYGLKLRPDIISRSDPSYPYRSPLQPFLAIYGLFGSLLIVIFMGFVVFLHGFWDTKIFFVSYGAPMLFAICYLGYKFFRSSKVHRLDQLDLDSGRREMDRIIWDEDQNYISSVGEIMKKGIGWLA
jgi:amino acid transporter